MAQLRAMSFLPRLKAVPLDDRYSVDQPYQAVHCERQFSRGYDVSGKLAVSPVTPRGDAPMSKACRPGSYFSFRAPRASA